MSPQQWHYQALILSRWYLRWFSAAMSPMWRRLTSSTSSMSMAPPLEAAAGGGSTLVRAAHCGDTNRR